MSAAVDRSAVDSGGWSRARAMAGATGEGVRACLDRAMRETWAAACAIVAAEPDSVVLDEMPAPVAPVLLLVMASPRQAWCVPLDVTPPIS